MSVIIRLEDIETLFKQTRFFNKIKADVIVKSYRQGINKALASTRTFGARKINERYNLKQGRIKRRFIKILRASGNDIERLRGFIRFQSKPIHLSEFMKGDTSPSQKGVSVKGRAKLRIKVRKGRARRMRNGFVGPGQNSNKPIIFKRKGKGRLKIVAQKVAGIGTLVGRKKFLGMIESHALQKLEEKYAQAFNHNLKQARNNTR